MEMIDGQIGFACHGIDESSAFQGRDCQASVIVGRNVDSTNPSRSKVSLSYPIHEARDKGGASTASRTSSVEESVPKTGITLVVLFLSVFSIYFVTAPRDVWSGDSIFYAMTARQLATEGSIDLSDQIVLTDPSADLSGSWLTKGPGGLVSIYPPGTALLAAPFFLLDPDSPGAITMDNVGTTNSEITIKVTSLTPATVASAAATAAAVAASFFLFGKLGATRAEAVTGALIFAFATGAWSVSSQRLWAHGPAMMWLIVGMCFREFSCRGLAGLTDLAAVITRPPTAIAGVTRTLMTAVRTRQVRPALQEFAWLVLGVAMVAAYNLALLGSDSPLGGYATVSRISDPDVGWWITNMAGALLDPERGVLIVSPFVLLLLGGLPTAWRSADPWVKDAALGGLVYFLLHNLSHDFRGGDGYFGYRYPLEAVAVSVPLLFCSYQSWVRGHRFRVAILFIGVVVSVLLQAFGVANQFG